MVLDLVERHKLTQTEVAKKLGITQPAVSQYLNRLRGSNHREILEQYGLAESVRMLSDDLASGKVRYHSASQMYCELCMRKSGFRRPT
jgi:predicted transcriptional regulator